MMEVRLCISEDADVLICIRAGHFVPSKANWRAFFRDYLLKGPAGDVPSPSAAPASQAASGAATPVATNPVV